MKSDVKNSTKSKQKKLILSTITLLFVFLHQSSIIFGINMSLSDIFLLMLFLNQVLKNSITLPIKQTLFFIILSIVVIFTATIFVPIRFKYYVNLINIINGYIKLLVVFLYFILGFNIIGNSKNISLDNILKWYSVAGFVIGIVGILFSIIDVELIHEICFVGNRYQGFMSDPNFYAIMQITILCYFNRIENNKAKKLIWLITSISVLASGSKTGILVLVFYTIFIICENISKNNLKIKSILFIIGTIIILIFMIPYLKIYEEKIFLSITNLFPSFERVKLIFTDIESAISEGGSGRFEVWSNAMKLIYISPILGIGVGTYGAIGQRLFDSDKIAHNTYLQLAVEWGTPLTVIFIIYVFTLLGKLLIPSKSMSNVSRNSLILRDIIIVILIASFSLSLNNARVFWVILGILVNLVNSGNNAQNLGKIQNSLLGRATNGKSR